MPEIAWQLGPVGVAQPNPLTAERHWRPNAVTYDTASDAAAKPPHSRKALETWCGPGGLCRLTPPSQTPSQPKGIGDSAHICGHSYWLNSSQTPSQPKGIGDRTVMGKVSAVIASAKPPHSRKALETLGPGRADADGGVVSQTPSQPKGIGDSREWIWVMAAEISSAKPPHSRKALETKRR